MISHKPNPYLSNMAAQQFTTISDTFYNPQKANLAEAFNPKKAGTKTSHVVFVLDSSSSMGSCKSATISGFNEFLDSQVEDFKVSGIKTFASLYTFDGNSLNKVFSRNKIKKVKHLNNDTYCPIGGTNLLDAIGGVMMDINLQLSKKKKKDRDSVIICVLTDGEENMSITFDNSAIKIMVEKAEGKNWGFQFMGANINAFHAGGAMGFRHENTIQFDTNNVKDVVRTSSRMANSMKAMYSTGMATDEAYATSQFTDQEREDANG